MIVSLLALVSCQLDTTAFPELRNPPPHTPGPTAITPKGQLVRRHLIDPAAPEPSGPVVALFDVLTLDVVGPWSAEDADPNPFRNYRLSFRFQAPSGAVYSTPGFFAGDGAGGSAGSVWRVRFLPDEAGQWTYAIAFHTGPDIAASTTASGTPIPPNGTAGSFRVAGVDSEAEGFFRRGRLSYVGEHHLRFSDGTTFVAAGCGSPENLLGFAGIDNTYDIAGGLPTPGLQDGIHHYAPHVADAPTGAPLWTSDQGVDSRGIFGAIEYLAGTGVGSIYVLLNNVEGDGREVYPWVEWWSRTRYDLSKLHQWYRIFEYAQRRGLMLNLFFYEKENFHVLGPNDRAIYLREMIARFGALPAIKWTIQEESDLNAADLLDVAATIRSFDPYPKPLGFHTNLIDAGVEYELYDAVLGSPLFDITSIQCTPELTSDLIEHWRAESAAVGRPWVVDVDEVPPGLSDQNAATQRRDRLWDALLSGGGYAAYCGEYDLPVGGDLTIEDFRTRAEAWNDIRIARGLFDELGVVVEPADELVFGESGAFGGAEAARVDGGSIVVYFPDASSTGIVDLTGEDGAFRKRWFDPRSGEWATSFAEQLVPGGVLHLVGTAPESPASDWTLVLAPWN